MPFEFVFDYYRVMVVLIAAIFSFVAAKTGGTYLSELVKKKMNPAKVSLHGTEEICGLCPALISFKSDIPKIFKKQAERDTVLHNFDLNIKEVKNCIDSLDDRVKKLFGMIEKTWQDEITELRQALRDKNFEIEKLKNQNG